jgi:hypothetical protein
MGALIAAGTFRKPAGLSGKRKSKAIKREIGV